MKNKERQHSKEKGPSERDAERDEQVMTDVPSTRYDDDEVTKD